MQRPAILPAGHDRCAHYGCQADYPTADNQPQAPLATHRDPSPSPLTLTHSHVHANLAPKVTLTLTLATASPHGGAYCLLGRSCRHHPQPPGPTQACRHHPGAPIFHEGSKRWPCCGVKKWDFDDFMAVPGCVVAEHQPVVWDD